MWLEEMPIVEDTEILGAAMEEAAGMEVVGMEEADMEVVEGTEEAVVTENTSRRRNPKTKLMITETVSVHTEIIRTTNPPLISTKTPKMKNPLLPLQTQLRSKSNLK